MSKRQFRLLLILNWVLLVVTIVAFLLTLKQLPPPLREYFDSQPLPRTFWRFYGVVWLAVWIVAWVGVYKFKNWARGLFLAAFVAMLLEIPFNPAVVQTGWVYFLGSLINAVGGMTIAVMYFSPISSAFKSEHDV